MLLLTFLNKATFTGLVTRRNKNVCTMASQVSVCFTLCGNSSVIDLDTCICGQDGSTKKGLFPSFSAFSMADQAAVSSYAYRLYYGRPMGEESMQCEVCLRWKDKEVEFPSKVKASC